MPKASKDRATGGGDFGPVSDRNEELGGYTVNFVTFHDDVDATPLLKGLPDDRCQAPHWGFVISGRLHYRFADHDETFEAGDAFYLPPGHIPVGSEPGSQIVQWSPTEDLRQTDEVMMKNMQAMQAGAPS